MLSAAGSPLVAGGTVPDITMAVKIKVIRSFMWQGAAQKVGSVIEVPDRFAGEMVASRKADFAPPEAPKAASSKEK